jgi:hypothetical protein
MVHDLSSLTSQDFQSVARAEVLQGQMLCLWDDASNSLADFEGKDVSSVS